MPVKKIKENDKMEAVAQLRNCPIAPRKMRMVADLIRGQKVNMALGVLQYQSKAGAKYMEKLLLSAISNWSNKYEDMDVEEADLYIKEIYVDGGKTLKRIQPAPQGRAHRIRKRSNHVTIKLDAFNAIGGGAEEVEAEEIKETKE